MEDVLNIKNKTVAKMGASSNINAARIIALQERKKQIEDNLTKRNQELRQLCIQEAELTGTIPSEMPLEPGETLPLIRRRVKTAFELPENLVENANKDTLITDLELQIQLHANLAEAALGLANEQNMSKTVKRQHRAEYQKHKTQCIALQEKLAHLKERAALEQHKQKKKLRTPDQVDDSISLSTNFNEPFVKSDLRHSIRSVKQNLPNESIEQRYSQVSRHLTSYRNSEMLYIDSQSLRTEDVVNSGFYRLSLNGYSKYMERRENINNMHPAANFSGHSSSYPYNIPQNTHIQQHGSHYHQGSPHASQHSPHMSQYSSHASQHSSHSSHSPHLSQHSPRMSQHSPQMKQHSPQLVHQRSTQSVCSYSPQYSEFNKLNMSNHVSPHLSHTQLHRQSSPSSVPPKSQYFSSHTIHGQPSYRQYQNEGVYRNPHQIQPHQQYEQMNVVTAGLGGCWKKSESGELVWCNSNTYDNSWQSDKRFGSLDRRKNRRMHKRISPSVDPKSATIASMPNYPDQIRNIPIKPSQAANRRTQENCQLVRTQSLGSVGAQTVDSVYPSDDNSSFESDNRSINDVNQLLRKHKEKEWLETSLDGPVLSPAVIPCPQPVASNVLAPEEKYVMQSPPPVLSPISTKPPLEIPAESNPSPRLPETNIGLFTNTNIPKNCTVVQAGHCKPYHEETKPFEMSDFYKYSTKFKKSPVKADVENSAQAFSTGNVNVHRNLNEAFDEGKQGSFSNSAQSSPYNNNNNNATVDSVENAGSLNTSLELGQITVSEHFSAEMNSWYRSQQNNNNNSTANTSKSRSTATLV